VSTIEKYHLAVLIINKGPSGLGSIILSSMNFFTVTSNCLVLLLVVGCLFAASNKQFSAEALDDFGADELEAWREFKRQYNKTYATPEEELKRQQIFIDNKRYVESFNTKDTQASFVPGVNPLSDLTTEEINESRCGFRAPMSAAEVPGGFLLEEILSAFNESLPEKDPKGAHDQRAWYDSLLRGETLDYRQRGLVSRVKDQGACGSCWAFATTGALESALAAQGRKILLSEQNLIDCSRNYGNNGCNGGLMDLAFDYIHDEGIMSAADYPYEAREGPCRFKASRRVTKVRGSLLLPRGNEAILRRALVLRGPLPVGIDAGLRSFHAYKSGVYDDRTCKSTLRGLNHAVLLVGYGTTDLGLDYWLLKNSWGRSWGENGYIRIARNRRNQCGVATYAVLPRL